MCCISHHVHLPYSVAEVGDKELWGAYKALDGVAVRAPIVLADQNEGFSRLVMCVLLRNRLDDLGHPWKFVELGFLKCENTRKRIESGTFIGTVSSWYKKAVVSPLEGL